MSLERSDPRIKATSIGSSFSNSGAMRYPSWRLPAAHSDYAAHQLTNLEKQTRLTTLEGLELGWMC
jgi:hypothetical protein